MKEICVEYTSMVDAVNKKLNSAAMREKALHSELERVGNQMREVRQEA